MNPVIRSFRDLDTWHVAMDLAVACYKVAKLLPASERFEMSSQIRKAATSVPSNVAEGIRREVMASVCGTFGLHSGRSGSWIRSWSCRFVRDCCLRRTSDVCRSTPHELLSCCMACCDRFECGGSKTRQRR